MTREALKLALKFIERVNKDGWILADFEPQMYATITAIKEALAQPEQEPWKCVCGANLYIDENGKPRSKASQPVQPEPLKPN